MDRFFAEHEDKKFLYPIINRVKFDAYLWNIGRIADQFVQEFAIRTAKEFRDAYDKGHLDTKLFEPWKYDQLKWIMSAPGDFAKKTVEDRTNRVLLERMDAIQNELQQLKSMITEQGNTQSNPVPHVSVEKNGTGKKIAKKFRTAVSVFRHEGFSGLFRVVSEKLR